MRKIKCFLSYSWQSRYGTAAKTIARRLSLLRDFSLWVDQREIVAGDRLFERIQAGVDDESDVFIPIICERYLRSHNCRMELKQAVSNARRHNTPIIPILLETCSLPIYMEDIVWADFRNIWDDSSLVAPKILTRELRRLAIGIRKHFYANKLIADAKTAFSRNYGNLSTWVFHECSSPAEAFPLFCEMVALCGTANVDPGELLLRLLNEYHDQGLVELSPTRRSVKYREHLAVGLPDSMTWTAAGGALWSEASIGKS